MYTLPDFEDYSTPDLSNAVLFLADQAASGSITSFPEANGNDVAKTAGTATKVDNAINGRAGISMTADASFTVGSKSFDISTGITRIMIFMPPSNADESTASFYTYGATGLTLSTRRLDPLDATSNADYMGICNLIPDDSKNVIMTGWTSQHLRDKKSPVTVLIGRMGGGNPAMFAVNGTTHVGGDVDTDGMTVTFLTLGAYGGPGAWGSALAHTLLCDFTKFEYLSDEEIRSAVEYFIRGYYGTSLPALLYVTGDSYIAGTETSDDPDHLNDLTGVGLGAKIIQGLDAVSNGWLVYLEGSPGAPIEDLDSSAIPLLALHAHPAREFNLFVTQAEFRNSYVTGHHDPADLYSLIDDFASDALAAGATPFVITAPPWGANDPPTTEILEANQLLLANGLTGLTADNIVDTISDPIWSSNTDTNVFNMSDPDHPHYNDNGAALTGQKAATQILGVLSPATGGGGGSAIAIGSGDSFNIPGAVHIGE